MATLEENLLESINQHVQSRELWQQQSTLHNSARASLVKTVGDSLSEITLAITDRIVLRYDNAKIFSKSKYMPAGYNTSETSSSWFLVDSLKEGETTYTGEEYTLALVDLFSAYSYPPGYYENPKYAKDQSASYMQFVFANVESTSAEIDSRLSAGQIKLIQQGIWWIGASRCFIPILKTDHHPYSALFVRFVNMPSVTGATAQPIATFGGDCSFRLNQITIFNQLNYRDLVQ